MSHFLISFSYIFKWCIQNALLESFYMLSTVRAISNHSKLSGYVGTNNNTFINKVYFSIHSMLLYFGYIISALMQSGKHELNLIKNESIQHCQSSFVSTSIVIVDLRQTPASYQITLFSLLFVLNGRIK